MNHIAAALRQEAETIRRDNADMGPWRRGFNDGFRHAADRVTSLLDEPAEPGLRIKIAALLDDLQYRIDCVEVGVQHVRDNETSPTVRDKRLAVLHASRDILQEVVDDLQTLISGPDTPTPEAAGSLGPAEDGREE